MNWRSLSAVVLAATAAQASCNPAERQPQRGAPAASVGSPAPTGSPSPGGSAAAAPAATTTVTPAGQRPTGAGPATPQQAIQRWNDALNRRDMLALEALYADQVHYYGRDVPRSQVLEQKRAALEKVPDFKQTIMGMMVLEQGDHAMVEFRKGSGPASKRKTVDARMRVTRYPGGHRIVEETDLISEGKHGKAALSCTAAAAAAVESTKEATSINGYIAALLEKANDPDLTQGGIGPQMDDDGTISYSLGIHHSDRFEAMAWYTVNPRTAEVRGSSEPHDDQNKVLKVPAAERTQLVASCASKR